MSTTTTEKQYICPGEMHPISRSVHLSRLAAFYPDCRDCPLRTDTGQLPRQTVERLQNTERRVQRKSLLTDEGVRGVYLNELTRQKADALASALAGLLWADAPLLGKTDARPRTGRTTGPSVVVGYDERTASPDIVTGVIAALLRMGCTVVDIAVTTRPCFCFTVAHVQASAGIFVTGAGCEPSWTGLDFVGRNAIPLSRGGELDRLEERLQHPISRPTRRAGRHRTFQAVVPYEAGLWKHFHALRPLKIVYGCPSQLVCRSLERIFETLPCRLISTDIPWRARNPLDQKDHDVVRLGETVRDAQADLGVLIDDDGARCGFVDEQGTAAQSQSITRLVAEMMLAEHPETAVVLEDSTFDALCGGIEESGGRPVGSGSRFAEIAQTMRNEQALFGGGDSGRYWFSETFPTCDAVLTIAKVLNLLSRSDQPFSQVLEHVIEAADPQRP